MEETLSDLEARLSIETNFTDTLYLEAGAGTGKTTSLISRILAIIREGKADINELAVITFTEAAAAELLDRIRQYLESNEESRNLSTMQNQKIRSALENIDSASIQTLHSFAADIIRQSPVEAGITPGFKILDDFERSVMFDDFYLNWSNDILENSETKEQIKVFISLGIETRFSEIASEFWDNYDLLSDTNFHDQPPALEEKSYLTEIITHLENELSSLMHLANDANDPLVLHLLKVFEIFRLFKAIDGNTNALLYLLRNHTSAFRSGFNISNRNIGKQADWKNDPLTGINGCKLIKEILKNIQDGVDDFVIKSATYAMMPILENLKLSILSHVNERKIKGNLLFHDLLVCARDMLRDNLYIRDVNREKYKFVLIDEFQDTDPIQAEIATFLCEDANPKTVISRSIDWETIETVPGKFFAVGDPKQSIFRFRRADINVGNIIKNSVSNKTLFLTDNFRSKKSIITWVNKVFSKLILESDYQPEYIPLESTIHTENTEDDTQVFYFGHEGSGQKNIRFNEALEISGIINKIIKEQWSVRDPYQRNSDGSPIIRPVQLDDICILSPTRSGFSYILDSFDNSNIPYRLESAFMMFHSEEIRDIINCFRAINNPKDSIYVIAAIKSPIFGCNDEEIYLHLKEGKDFNCLNQDNLINSNIGNALKTIHSFYSKKTTTTLSLLIEEFFRERYVTGLSLNTTRVREQWRKYQLLIDKVRILSEHEIISLGKFIEWIEAQILNDVQSLDSAIPEGDENAIRVMTIHRSKGLEFPIVFVVGISGMPQVDSPSVIFDAQNNFAEVRVIGKIKTTNYDVIDNQEKLALNQEKRRLLYVACTRARDYMIISTHRAKNSLATMIVDLFEDSSTENFWQELDGILPDAEFFNFDTSDTNNNSIITKDIRENWKIQRGNLLSQSRTPPLFTATQLVNELKDEIISESEPWKRGRSGTAIGRAVHSILQTIDLTSSDKIEQLSEFHSNIENISIYSKTVEALVRTALSSNIMKRAITSNQLWREVHIMAPFLDRVGEGIVDLVFEEDDGLVIVDYKTDSFEDNQIIDDIIEKYKIQILFYANAITKATGKHVKEASLYLLRKDELFTIENPQKDNEYVENIVESFIHSM